ncbi:MAG TPA: hypothetical protein VFW47_05120 [Phenylobacterium sp.]|nr:hypothetical protein [Phenylobacterium sp.]
MSRIVIAVLAAILGLNGLVMLFASFWWYNAVPGVPATGAFNPHFVRDIGMAYLVAAGGLAWFLWRPAQGWPALVGAAAFLTLHASIHVFDATCGGDAVAATLRDFPGVYLPALATAWIAVARRPA